MLLQDYPKLGILPAAGFPIQQEDDPSGLSLPVCPPCWHLLFLLLLLLFLRGPRRPRVGHGNLPLTLILSRPL